MVLVRNVLVPRERVDEHKRELMRSHWPGGEGVSEKPEVRCRAVRELTEQNGFVWLECVYEG